MKWLRSSSKWLQADRYFDAFYALCHGGLNAFRHVVREMADFCQPEPSARKKPSYLPQLEPLEVRQVPSSVTGRYRFDDPRSVPLTGVGEVAVDLNTGAARISQPLDFDSSPGTSLGGNPALVYNGNTVDVHPIIDVFIDTHGDSVLPDNIKVDLFWNGNPSPVGSSGYAPGSGLVTGDTLEVAVQSGVAVTQADYYDWSVNVELDYLGPPASSVTLSCIGHAAVVPFDNSAYGAGWGIDSVDRLVVPTTTTTGFIYVYGNGDSRWFTGSGGTYTSSGDFGTLTGSTLTGFDYTANGVISEQFDGTGLLTSAHGTDNITRTYAYNSGNLTQVVTYDGVSSTYYSTATLAYSGGQLHTIAEPGGRTLTLTQSSGNLTQIVDATGSARAMGYDGSHRLTSDSFAPYGTTLTYTTATGNDVTGELSKVNFDSSTYTMVPAVGKMLQGMTYMSTGDAHSATFADPLTHTTSYDLDDSWRIQTEHDPIGSMSWAYDPSNGLLTQSVDADGHATAYTYDTYGQLASQTNPAGDSVTYSRDSSFHDNITQTVESGGITTTASYNATTLGQMTQWIDGDGFAWTYTWSGLTMTGMSDPYGDATTYSYDVHYRLIKTVDPDTHTSTVSYDGNGNESVTTDGDTHATTSTYDNNNRLVAVHYAAGDSESHGFDMAGFETSSTVEGVSSSSTYNHAGWLTTAVVAGATTVYGYDLAGRTTLVTDPRSNTESEQFDNNDRVTQLIDLGGGTTTYSYDNAGNLTLTVDHYHHATSQTYDGDNRLVSTLDADGNATSKAYDAAGRVTASTDGAGVTTYSYFDKDNNLTLSIDGNGNSVTNNYDHADRLTETIGPGTLSVSYEYDQAGNVTKMINGGSHTTLQSYDAANNLTKTVDPDLHTTSYTYDADNRRTATINHRGYTSTTTYNGNGQVASTSDFSGHTSYSYYDTAGRVTKTVDGANGTFQQAYDANGNVTQSIDANFKITTNVYDAANRRTSSTDPLTHVTSWQYDFVGNNTTVVDANGRTVTNVYDPANARTQMIDGNGFTWNYSYDGDYRVTQVTDPDGNTIDTAYDGNGNVTSVRDGAHRVTSTSFDPSGHVTLVVDHGVSTLMAYDVFGDKTQATDGAGGVTTYAYDLADQLTLVTDPDSNGTTYTLDADGNRTLITDAFSYTTVQAFDGDGRVTQMITANSATINYSYDGDGRTLSNGNGTFAYDPNGRMTKASNSNGAYDFAYDDAGRLTRVIEPFSYTLHYTYDAVGNQLSEIDSYGGTVSSKYDGDNYLTKRNYDDSTYHMQVDFTNNREGWNTTMSRSYSGSPVADTVTDYDGAGNITHVVSTDPSSTIIDEFYYTLDATTGDVKDKTETQNSATNTLTFGYDSGGQLNDDNGVTQTFDSAGNRTGPFGVTTGNHIAYDANWTYKYDNNGNITQKNSLSTNESWTYAWDATNELTGVAHYDASGSLVLKMTYKYDAFGQMISRTSNGSTVNLGIDGWNASVPPGTGNEHLNVWVHAKNGASATELTRYLWSDRIDQQLGRIDFPHGAGERWMLNDRENSIRDIIDNSATLLDSIAYDGYGNIQSGELNKSNRGWYAWTGRQLDIETELQYNRARWYDASIGRWMSQDPLGFDAGDSNLYRYVNNRPDLATDPSGLWSIVRNHNNFLADATAEKGDTIEKLAIKIGLRPEEFVEWLTIAGGKLDTVGKAGVPIEDLKVDDVIEAGQKVQIPNTVQMIWIGALEGLGRDAVGWEKDITWLKDRGFHVGVVQYDGENKNVKAANFEKILPHVFKNGTKKKELHGVEIAGHGGYTGIQSHDRKVNMSYADMSADMTYHLGIVILNVCFGKNTALDKDFPRGKIDDIGGLDLSAGLSTSVFAGTVGKLIPTVGTHHPWQYMKAGDQGTKK